MAMQDEGRKDDTPSGVDAKVMEEYDHWIKVDRVAMSMLVPIVILVGVPFGLHYMNGAGFLKGVIASTVSAFLVWFVLLPANFKPAKPMRIAREAACLLVLIGAAFLLHCGKHHFGVGGDGVFRAAIKSVCTDMSLIFVLAFLAFPFPLGYKLERWRFVRKGAAYREKQMKRMQNGLGRKVDAFLRKHPSLVLSSMKEYVFLSVRYGVWAVTLFSLANAAYSLVRG